MKKMLSVLVALSLIIFIACCGQEQGDPHVMEIDPVPVEVPVEELIEEAILIDDPTPVVEPVIEIVPQSVDDADVENSPVDSLLVD